MLDALHLPGMTRGNVQVFTRVSTVTNTQWLTWQKPRGVSMLQAIVIGGGGGGGGGFTRAAAAAGLERNRWISEGRFMRATIWTKPKPFIAVRSCRHCARACASGSNQG